MAENGRGTLRALHSVGVDSSTGSIRCCPHLEAAPVRSIRSRKITSASREGYQNFKLEQIEQSAPAIDFSAAPPNDSAQLVYFIQAMQRTQLIGHFVSKGVEIPLHYAITGSIILKRVNRQFQIWSRPELRSNVILPFDFVDDKQLLESFSQDQQVHLVDSAGKRPEYTQLRIAAVRKAHELTLEERSRLYMRWRKEEGSDESKVLVVDGHIADVPNKWLTRNLIAIDQRVYVPWQNSELLEQHLLIAPFHRGPLLQVTNTVGDDPMHKYMFFLRLRTSSQADPEFGLLRCTIVANDANDAIERANQLARLMIEERLPVTFPAPDWDRLIFPMKLCKTYLDSLVATREAVKSYFARA